MKQLSRLKNTLLALMLFASLFAFNGDHCAILHKGIFTYGTGAEMVKVVIKGKNHTEYHNDGKYIIKSSLEWLNECEYKTTIKKVTIPGFPYKIGETMHVKINSVIGEAIHYTATVQGSSWKGKFTKIK